MDPTSSLWLAGAVFGVTTDGKLNDNTPAKYRGIPVGPSCPAVFSSGNKTYVIIGKLTGVDKYPELRGRVGVDEGVIEISAELLEAAIRGGGKPNATD